MTFPIGLGVPSVDYPLLRSWARAADEVGFDFVAVGDNPGHMRDTYVSLAVLAEATARCRIGTATTNPAHRDVLVVASALSSVATLAPGRSFLGLGRGRAHRTASIDGMRRHITALRELWSRGVTVVDGETLRLDWDAPAVPIVVCASGPRMLQLAGELADGVIVESGVSPEAVAYAREHLRLGAARAGRDADALDVWWYLKAAISSSREEAVGDALAPTAASGGLVAGADPAGRVVPERFRDGVLRVRSLYDKSSHLDPGPDDPNRRLLDADPDLRAYLFDRFTIAGTPDDWVARIQQLQGLGIQRLYIAAVVPDPLALVRSVGASVLPRVS